MNWYVCTATPYKKNIMLVIDDSGSMVMTIGGINHPDTPTRESLAKEAANTVLNTLSPKDYVGIVTFGKNAKTAPGCLGVKMAQATEENKGLLRNFINSTEATEPTTLYETAFAKAFQLFNASKMDNPEQFKDSLDMILFLTDGVAHDTQPKILEKIASGQSWMGNKVHIFVYGLGQELLLKTLDDKMKLLYQIADQNNQIMSMPSGTGNTQLQWPVIPSLTNRTSSVGPPGNITFISDSDGYHLKDIMGKYYTQFPLSQYPQLTISLPHSDKLSGVVVTLGLPTIDDNGNFFGVTAVDVSYEQMFYEVVHFKQKRHSYAFIVGSGGTVLSHPYLSLPKDNVTQPVFYSVQQLEPSLSTDALTNISQGIEGEEAATAVVWTDNGSKKQLRNAVFYIRPLPGFEQNYTIVFVIFNEDLHNIFNQMVNNRTDVEIVTRIHNTTDFNDDDEFCFVNDKILQDTSNSTVMFSRDISRHLACQPFGVHQKCNLYGSPGGQNDSLYEDNNSTLLQGSLSVDMFVTEAVSQYWSQSVDIQRRYIGTESGIFRINPGIPVLDTLYDPREDSWYNEAVQNSDVFIFRMESIIGQPDIVSVISTYKTNSTSGLVGGVIGSEIYHHHLNSLLRNAMADCTKRRIYSCYIVDDKGYITYHFQIASVKKHITSMLPRIANYLIQNRNLEMNWCKDLNIGERHLSYRLVTTGQVVQYNGSNVCGDNDFILSQITHTNLYLLVSVNTTYCPPGSVYQRVPVCHCTDECKTCDIKQKACQCPCVCKNNQVAGCDRQFDINSGFRPCAESRKRFTLQRLLDKFDQNTHQNVSKCKQSCITHSNQSDCEADSDCTWCQGGFYKTYPACVQHCIRDRVEVKFFSPCINVTDISSKDQDQLMGELKDRVVSLISSRSIMNFTVTQPQVLSNNIVGLFIETSDGSVIPDESLNQLKPAVQVQTNMTIPNVTFLAEENENDFSALQVTLYVKGINFTDKLQHSLSLRQYVHHVIHSLAKSIFIPSVASTVTDIWLQNNTISFWITNKANVKVTEQVKPLLERQKIKSLEFNLLGDNVTVEHIETSGSYDHYCPVDCYSILTEERCNSQHHCHWEGMENNCTNNPLLPERMIVTFYFPCLGLYEKINDTAIEDGVLAEFKQKLQNMSLLTSKVAHSFAFKKGTDTVGRYIQFIIQGRLLDPSVTETIWRLKHLMSWSNNFTITIPYYNETDYRSDVKRRSYQDFTNLQISLAIKDVNLEDFLTRNPLNGRLEIQKAISKIARSHFLPEVAKSVDNIGIYKNYIEFMVSKLPDSDVNLRLEYKRLKLSIDTNHTKFMLFEKELEIDTDYFTGSFQNICPRTCNEVYTEVECRSIGGCQWSQKHQCEDNFLLTEKKEIKIVFPCAGLHNLSNVDRNKLLSLVERSIRRLPLNISHNAIHNFTIGKEFADSIKFVIQGMSKDPLLVTSYKHLTKLIHDGQITLGISQNGSSIVGIDAENYDSLMMYLEYPVFKKMTTKEEKQHVSKVKRQLNDFLMPDIQFKNGYFHRNKNNTTLILDAQRVNKTVDIEDIIDKIRKFISIGGLSIITHQDRYLPTNVKYRGIYIDKCLNNCTNSSNDTTCLELGGCHLETADNVTSCTNNHYLSDKITFNLYLPCNSTQSLNLTEIQETKDDLLDKITNILSPVSNKVVMDIDIRQNDVILTLQATSLFPYIQSYTEKIKQSQLNFGPNSDQSRFTAISSGEFTDVEIALEFNTIDFDGIQNSLLATKTDIIESLQRKLDSILLAETMKNFHVLSVKDDTLIFKLQKDKNGLISMSEQIDRLEKEVKNDMFIIDLSYIRPVIATSYRVKETFKSLCPEKYQVTILPTFSSIGQANTTGLDYQTTGTFISPSRNMVSVVMVYNSFEVTERKLQSYINVTANLDICFIPVTQLYTAKKKCRLNICIPSINPTVKPTKDNKSPNVTMEIPGHYDIGPGEAAGITLASLLGLLLAIGAAVLAYNMKKKASMKKMEAKAGREIEEMN